MGTQLEPTDFYFYSDNGEFTDKLGRQEAVEFDTHAQSTLGVDDQAAQGPMPNDQHGRASCSSSACERFRFRSTQSSE